MGLISTFECDNCDAKIETGKQVAVTRSAAGESAIKYLCPPCDVSFMDGTVSGEDLFLND